jgi:hypothetical protein
VSKLDAARRNALPSGAFAGPDRSFPIPDASHARNALARVSQAVNAGRMSGSKASRIRAKAHAKLAHEVGESAHREMTEETAHAHR